MLINAKNNLIGLTVKTKSNQMLGKIVDFEVDSETQTIEKYYVKSQGLVRGLFEDKLIINKRQVISINNELMIVQDAVITESQGVKKNRLAAAGSSGGVVESVKDGS